MTLKIKHLGIFLMPLLMVPSAHAEKHKSLMAHSETYNPTSWGDSFLPQESGLRKSDMFGGITFTGRYASYTGADTWYLTYATNGAMYSSWTDGNVNGEKGRSPKPRCGKITGNDPLHLSVDVVGDNIDHNGGGGKFGFGRYPCAQLMYHDIWYYGTYLLEQNDYSANVPNRDWPILQPFIGLRVSGNFGKDWHDQTQPDSPIFENAHDKWVNDHNVAFNPYEVMIGAPHFVDFGPDMAHAPKDEATGRKWAYMVAHGADAGSDLAHNSWISGDNVYLLRILMPEGRDIEANAAYVNEASNWQYLTKDGSYKAWNRDNLQEVYDNIKPIVDATGCLGNVSVTYNAPLGKFIMALSRVDNATHFNTLILEADAIEGEYKVIQYMKGFATASYFMMIPSRFISDDGRTMWLGYSSNYFRDIHHPAIGGSLYALCLSEFTLDDTHEALGRKYEAESMQRQGGVRQAVDTLASNGAAANNIARVGDELTFYSKSKGNAIGVAVGRTGKFAKRITVCVNGQRASKLVVVPSGNDHKFDLQYIPLAVSYGDKVTLRIDHDDMAYNRLYDDVTEAGFTATPSGHLWGTMDYAIVDSLDFHAPEVSVKKEASTHTAVMKVAEAGEYALIIRYRSGMRGLDCGARHLTLTVNKEASGTLDFVPTNDETDDASVVTRIRLKKGKNIVRLTSKGHEGEEAVTVTGMACSLFIP